MWGGGRVWGGSRGCGEGGGGCEHEHGGNVSCIRLLKGS